VIYIILAELVMLVHFSFLAFVVFGALLVAWRKWVALLHIPAFVWGALISFMGWPCPLTPLENHFLRLGGREGYDTGFIEHYIAPVLYPEGLTRTDQVVMGAGLLVLNVALYSWIFRRTRGPEQGASDRARSSSGRAGSRG